MNPKTAKIWMLALAGVVIVTVMIFFRKPVSERVADKQSAVQSQPLVLRRDVAVEDQTIPKVVVDLPELAARAAPTPVDAPSVVGFAANSPHRDSVTASHTSDSIESAAPAAQPNLAAEVPRLSPGFIPPAVATLPPQTAHGRPVIETRLVDIPPLPTATPPPVESVPKLTSQSGVMVPSQLVKPGLAPLKPESHVSGLPNVAPGKTRPPTTRKKVIRSDGPPRYHRIVDGDTLERISTHYFGSPERAQELFELNRNVLDQPDLLPLRKQLLIPPGFQEVVTKSETPVGKQVGPPARNSSGPTQTPMPEAVLNPIPDKVLPETQLVPVP